MQDLPGAHSARIGYSLRVRSKLLTLFAFLLSISMTATPLAGHAANQTFNSSWQGSGDGARSTWSMKLGKVAWSANYRAPLLTLNLTETQGKLKFDKKKKNGFTLWFTNSGEYSGNPDSLQFPAVVLNGDPTSTGSTPNLIYQDRVVIGRASSLEAGSACSTGSKTGFSCVINAIFSQDGGTITNYLGEGVTVFVSYFEEVGSETESDVLVFEIPHKSFPATELAKKFANSFRSSGSTVEKKYTNKEGQACRTLNQVSASDTSNLVCKRVSGRNVWVVDEGNAASNAQSKKQIKAKRNCTSSQLSNLGNFYSRIEQANLKIKKLNDSQQSLRDQINEFRRRGVAFNEPSYRSKIAANQAEIVNQQNVISKNAKGFESIDSICKQNKYQLDTVVADEASIDELAEDEVLEEDAE